MTGLEDWEVEIYADESHRESRRAWIEILTPQRRIALGEAVWLVLARRGLAVVETEFAQLAGSRLQLGRCCSTVTGAAKRSPAAVQRG